MGIEDRFKTVVQALKSGGIVVVRTDTIYGIIALASDESAVEKVYAVKRRDASKQCIVLISDTSQAPAHADIIGEYSNTAQVPTSVIVPASTEAPWLLRGGDSIAYRVVRDPFLKKVVAAVGPVVAPSANPEGWEPARTIEEARNYFGSDITVYVDGGEVPTSAHASRIVKVNADGSVASLRN